MKTTIEHREIDSEHVEIIQRTVYTKTELRLIYGPILAAHAGPLQVMQAPRGTNKSTINQSTLERAIEHERD